MSKNTTLVAIIAGIVGLVAGFMLANSLNRSELASRTLAAPTATPAAMASDPGAGAPTLTPDEIKAKIESADRNPTDFSFQKGLGLSLYRYASLKQDAALLPDTIRIMQRALNLDSADRDLLIGLGNAHFDVGYFNKDNQSFERSREFYNKALARVPADADVRTDLALTYYLQQPPDLDRAVAEFEKGLEVNPKHERSLQFLVQTYAKKNDTAKATAALERLRAVNPANPALTELASIASGKTPPQ